VHIVWVLLLLPVTVWAPGVGTAAERLSRGATVAQTCVTCHGPGGRSQGAIPSLASLTSADLLGALRAFRAESPQSTVMHRIARGLSEADMTAVAAYFATLPRRGGAQP
jgi:cytochrome c553